jgi:hypothetical protein
MEGMKAVIAFSAKLAQLPFEFLGREQRHSAISMPS